MAAIITDAIPLAPRRAVPHACIVDGKPHIQTFLADMLEERRFVISQCGRLSQLYTILKAAPPDLIVLGSLPDEAGVVLALRTLAAENFKGKVMLFGAANSAALAAAREFGEKLRLSMLPPLRTPFRDSTMDENLASFLPIRPPPSLPVDIDEALDNGWLELWYQPKIDPHILALRGAEAQIRLRHPTLGIVPPSYFLPSNGDPSLHKLSEFVMTRAMSDWSYFASCHALVEIAVDLPIAAFKNAQFIDLMRDRLSTHPAFTGVMVQLDGAEVLRDLPFVRSLAKRLQYYNIKISLANVAAEGSSFAGMPDFPFAELKVDWKQIASCAHDLKLAACTPVLDAAGRFGVPTVADGIDTRDEFETARRMGFHLVEGDLFAKPVEARKFVRAVRERHGAETIVMLG